MTTPAPENRTQSSLPVPRDGILVLLLAAVVLGVGSWWSVGGVCGVYHDDAIYVITAKALADGEGYRLINLPDQPYQTKYPILVPSVLALVWLLWPSFPDNLVAMQGICLLSGALAVGLGYWYAVRYRYFPRGIAAASALLSATAPLFVYYASLTLSEMPFALLVVLVCWCFDAALERPAGSRARQIALGIVLALPFWARTVGLALVPAGLLLLHRAGRPKRWVAAGATAALVPWAAWMLIGLAARQADGVEGYYTNYLSWYSSLGLPLAARVFSSNMLRIIWSPGGLALDGTNDVLLRAGVAPILVVLTLGVFAWLPLCRQAYRGRVLPTMLCAYLLLVAVWPWPPDRFIVPILPMVVGYMLVGISFLPRQRLPQARWRIAAVTVVMVFAAANLICLSRYRKLSHLTRFPQNRLGANPVRWESYEHLFEWIRIRTDPDAVVATELDPMFYLYTSRRGFRPFVSRPGAMFYGSDEPVLGTVDELERAFDVYRPKYVVITPMQVFDEPFVRLVEELRVRHPGWLERVYEDPTDHRFAIFRLRGDPQVQKRLSSVQLPLESDASVE